MKTSRYLGVPAVCLLLNFLPTTAPAATVVLDGLTATDILDLDVGGTAYNVSFEFDTFNNLNTGGNFPFLGDGANASSATNAIVAALNGASATSAGPSSSSSQTLFLVPYTSGGSTIIGLYSSSWQNFGVGGALPDTDRVYATFHAVVPVPAATWLFITGLAGLIGISRHRESAQS